MSGMIQRVGKLSEGIDLFAKQREPQIAPPTPQAGAVRFQYDELAPEVAALARQAADDIRAWQKKSITDIGNALIHVKAALDHGAFGRWLDAEFAMGARTAENYMAAAKFLEGKSETISYLPPAAIYALAAPSADPVVVDAVLAEIEGGKVVPATVVRERLAEATKTRVAAEAEAKKTPDEIRKAKEKEKLRRQAEKDRRDKWISEQEAADAKRHQAARVAADFLVEKLTANDIATLLKLMKPTDFWHVTRFFIPHNYFGDAVRVADAESVLRDYQANTAPSSTGVETQP